MIDVNQLRKGTTYIEDGEIYRVLDYHHNKPGRGNAIIRVKVRNLRSGATLEKTYISGDRVQDIRVDRVEMQYLYNDGDFYYFMNTDTYEQIPLSAAVLGESTQYLVDNMLIYVLMYEGEPLDVDLPTTVDLKVIEAPPGFAGDTATGATKQVTTETGLKVDVPLFIEEGDVIRVDTRTGEYVTRV